MNFSFLLSVKFTIKDPEAMQECVYSQVMRFGSAATYIIPSTFSFDGAVSNLYQGLGLHLNYLTNSHCPAPNYVGLHHHQLSKTTKIQTCTHKFIHL